MPSYLRFVRLGCYAIDKLFSYEVGETPACEEGRLWTFDCEKVTWSKRQPVVNDEINKEVRFLHSMQIAVATQINKVFLLGGSVDENFNEISD